MTGVQDQIVVLRSLNDSTSDHDGAEVEVLFELGDDLRDIESQGRLFRVKTLTGDEIDAQIEELHIEATPVRSWEQEREWGVSNVRGLIFGFAASAAIMLAATGAVLGVVGVVRLIAG